PASQLNQGQLVHRIKLLLNCSKVYRFKAQIDYSAQGEKEPRPHEIAAALPWPHLTCPYRNYPTVLLRTNNGDRTVTRGDLHPMQQYNRSVFGDTPTRDARYVSIMLAHRLMSPEASTDGSDLRRRPVNSEV